jgi:hypothetical protein
MRGWTLPSVMTVGAAQILLKQSGEHLPGDIVMAGAGPLLWLYADQLLRAGRRPAAIVLTAPRGNLAAAAGAAPLSLFSPETAKGLGWIARARAAGVPVLRAGRGLGVEAAGNRLRLRVAETGRRIEADWVLLHEGVIPRIQLPLAAGCALAWNEAGHYLAPLRDEFGRSSVGTIAVAGDGAGIVGAAAAAVDGEIAGLGLVLDLAPSEAMRSRLAGHVAARKRLVAARPLLDALYKPAPLGPRLEPDTILCRCEDVRAGEIARLMDGGLTDLNAVKSLCRAGMGPCQGQQCGISMFRMLRERRPDTPVSAYLRIRPPVAPIPLGALAGADPAELEGTA